MFYDYSVTIDHSRAVHGHFWLPQYLLTNMVMWYINQRHFFHSLTHWPATVLMTTRSGRGWPFWPFLDFTHRSKYFFMLFHNNAVLLLIKRLHCPWLVGFDRLNNFLFWTKYVLAWPITLIDTVATPKTGPFLALMEVFSRNMASPKTT